MVVMAMRSGEIQLRRLEDPGSARRQRALKRRFRRSSHSAPPRRTGPLSLAVSCALVFVGVFAAGLALPALPALPDLPALPGPILSVSGRPILEAIAVVDGDTVRLSSGEKIRISNIDTPETPPRSSCPEEARLAQAATTNLRSMVAGARDVRFVPDWDRERDAYGRLLGRVVIDGADVGEAQIAAGLAQPWQGHRAWWCG